MKRREFVEKSLMMGVGLPALSQFFLNAESEWTMSPIKTNFSGKVVVVGAGAAGMAAGYLLKSYGIDFTIIEAAPNYGGRLKKAENFADFPIDLGAEWIHTNPKVLNKILGDHHDPVAVDTIVYNPKTIKSWNKDRLKSQNYISYLYSEWKFKNTTWFDFFEQHIVPEISDRIVLDTPILEINYDTKELILKALDHQTYRADKVLLTTSIKTLQSNQITFNPPLPKEKTEAISKVFMGDGLKIFVSFKEKFYPDLLAFGSVFQALNTEDKFVYDAAFKKNSKKHILALFAINDRAAAYTKLSSETEIIKMFLAELDEIFDGQASPNYLDHIIQNWSAEPYVQGAYSYSFDGKQKSIVDLIQKPVNNRIYFAGEALSIKNQAMVHGACESAYETVATMLLNS